MEGYKRLTIGGEVVFAFKDDLADFYIGATTDNDSPSSGYYRVLSRLMPAVSGPCISQEERGDLVAVEVIDGDL